jgi:hypothetical protein
MLQGVHVCTCQALAHLLLLLVGLKYLLKHIKCFPQQGVPFGDVCEEKIIRHAL